MRFLIDEQLPPSLAIKLRDAGHEAEHVRDVGLGGATDLVVWREAVARGAALLTRDEDFLEFGRGDLTAPVVWIRLGNTTSKALWTVLGPLLPEIVKAVETGETLIEVVSSPPQF